MVRTRKAAIAYAHGKYRARFQTGTDIDVVAKRAAAVRTNKAQGLDTCWNCLCGIPTNADKCSVCGTEVVPF